MKKLATVHILDSYYAFVITPKASDNNLEVRLLGYTGKTITGSQPQFRAEITWVWNKNSQGVQFLRERYLKIIGKGTNPIPMKPENGRELLKKSKYILLDGTLPNELRSGIKGFLVDFQVKASIVEFTNCPFCVLIDRITLMADKKSYIALNDQKICQTCAITEVQKELKGKGVSLTPAIIQYLQTLLQQTKNVAKTIDVLGGNQAYGSGTIIKEVEKLIGEYHEPTPLENINLPDYIRENLQRRDIGSLLPAQVKALHEGLMDGENLLIVADTSAGKTLIGEMASLKQILVHKKQVLYLSPLVALANTKYESFKKNFKKEGFKIGLRVGVPRLKLKNVTSVPDSNNLHNKDIIVGTYEGFDILLRSGYKLKNIGLVIVDEIQTLQEEEDRGPDLDGLIARIKMQRNAIQIIGLSATIGNPEQLAGMLNLKLVWYKGRPIPLEVHVLISPSNLKKKDRIAEIIEEEKKIVSSFGYTGQAIVFTNSRRKTKEIRDYLRSSRIITANYHSGLPYGTRKQIEEQFDAGKIDCVVATYALGAGVDFPASVVIFESLQMGKELLLDKTNIFFQMMGRAGRLGKHDKGKVIILATPFPPTASVQMTEIELAMNMLKATYQKVDPEYDLNRTATQLLATLSSFQNMHTEQFRQSFELLLGKTGTFEETAKYLVTKQLINFDKDNKTYGISKLGQAGAMSFLTVKEISFVLEKVDNNMNPIEIAILMEPFENIHLSPYLIGYLEKTLKSHVPTRLFTSSALELLDQASIKVQKLDKTAVEILIVWNKTFFNCECSDRPYCDHGLINVNRLLINLRVKKLSPEAIARVIEKDYGLYAFPGDILRWLESILHKLEGIKKVTAAVKIDISEKLAIIEDAIQDPDKHTEEKLQELDMLN
jgi:helicase